MLTFASSKFFPSFQKLLISDALASICRNKPNMPEKDEKVTFNKISSFDQSFTQTNCCSFSFKKVFCGILILILVTASWVGATQVSKYEKIMHNHYSKFLVSEGNLQC